MGHNLYDFGLEEIPISDYPDLGEHNNLYLYNLGYTSDQINLLYKDKIIFTES